MRFSTVYRLSFYATTFLAAMILCHGGAWDNWINQALPAVVAGASIVAFLTVDRNPRLGLSLQTSLLLSWGAIFLTGLEYASDRSNIVLPLTHVIVYLQLIKIFRHKSVQDEWWIIGMGTIQVMVGAVLGAGREGVGVLIVAWAACALWTLGLFHLYRAGPRGAAARKARGGREPYAGLFDFAFLLSSLRVGAVTLALGCLIFLLTPRFSDRMPTSGGGGGRALTGFDPDRVNMGRMTEILENEDVVMKAQLFDEADQAIDPGNLSNELLWRGVCLANYANGSWRRSAARLWPMGSYTESTTRLIKQVVTLEPTSMTARFALRPVLRAEPRDSGKFLFDARDGSITASESREAMEYVAWSAAEPDATSMEESPRGEYRSDLLRVDRDLREELRRIAEPIVAGIPAERQEARARALAAWLQDTENFGYTLSLGASDPRLDPVLDFLTNTREGNCEYFAASLVLMLRSIGIPARLVNGFKGGDWNSLNRTLYVRQKHAHSWTEAYVQDHPSGWITLDPTPAGPREESVARVGNTTSSYRQFSDMLREIWIRYIQGFNGERQRELIYRPIGAMMRDAREGFRMMGEAARDWLRIPDASALFSAKGFAATFLVLGGLTAAIRGLAWVWRRLARGRGRRGGRKGTGGAEVAFYKRLTEILRRAGIERGESETPREFGARSSSELAARWPEAAAAARGVVPAVVEAFYRTRFGGRTVSAVEREALESGLRRLEGALGK